MTGKITTLLFDLDGTLINTNELIIKTFQVTLQEFLPDRVFTREDILPFIGPSLMETFREINPAHADEMRAFYREYNLKHHDDLILEYDGFYEAIRALYEEDYKLGIVSTKMYDTIMRGLKVTGLDKFFQVVIGLDQVSNAKPDPEGIEMALSLLNATKEEAIMIGDNYHDIEAGKNAETLTAGVAWAIKGPEHLAQFQPDFMLEKMSDLLAIVRDEE
ncbi:TPA: pyrophosphatase PpaX [Listeria monocytogenes]|uniref:pyrophosphatase PpaX n=1 Tax=Listeria monocytogenes TaxID=1639 RepID=UPI000869174D|nr:pyrophosphatase PpaX [Listeria monocytogenes]OER72767.1 pyrophosphatase [Listeria monocytogenes]HAO5989291.1 pyrophosphatase PpaX [Listeria monocytogenes]